MSARSTLTPDEPALKKKTSIFVYPDGSSIPIFVEANGVKDNRPKLIRTLKNGGAEICRFPSDAKLILVDPLTAEGRQFVRTWDSNLGRTVLDTAWVSKSLAAGRPLLQEDNYGGLSGLDPGEDEGEGSKADEDEDGGDGEVPKRSTKRSQSSKTPSLANKSRKPRTVRLSLHGMRSQSKPSSKVEQSEPSIKVPLSPAHTTPKESNSPSDSLDLETRFPQNQQQMSFPLSLPVGHAIPTSPTNISPTTITATNMPSASPFAFPDGYPNNMMANNLANMPNMPNMMDPSFWPAFTLFWQFQQSQPVNPTSPWMMNGYPPMFNNGPQNMQPQLEPEPQPQVQQPPPYTSPIPEQSHPVDLSLLPASPTASQPHQSTSKRKSTPVKSSTTGKDLTPARKRRRTSEIETRSPKNDKPPSISSSVSLKRRSITTPAVSFASTSSSSPRTSPTPESSPRLFVRSRGKPMQFFLQIDLRGRMNTLQLIKQHGGIITSNLKSADIVILYPHASSFSKLFDEVAYVQKHPLRSNYVQACIDANELVDDTEFRISNPKVSKPRSGKPRSAPNTPQKKKSSSTPQAKPALGPTSAELLRSPSPPPNLQTHKRFDEEDSAYMLRYLRVALQRNSDETNAALAIKLASKVTSHTAPAWINYLSLHQSEIDQIRKEVGSSGTYPEGPSEHNDEGKSIVSPDAQLPIETTDLNGDVEMSEVQPSVEAEQPVEQPNNATDGGQVQPQEDPTNAAMDTAGEQTVGSKDPTVLSDSRPPSGPLSDTEQDLKTITDFFSGNVEGGQSTMTWHQLEAQFKCRTARSWPAFYVKHKNRITEMRDIAVLMKSRKTLIGSSGSGAG